MNDGTNSELQSDHLHELINSIDASGNVPAWVAQAVLRDLRKLQGLIDENKRLVEEAAEDRARLLELEMRESRYRGALLAIIRHQEMVAGGMEKVSTTAQIAREALG